MPFPKDIFNELCEYNFTPYTHVNVCLASRNLFGDYSYELLMMSEGLKNEFLNSVKAKLDKLRRDDKKHDIELVDYEELYKPDQHQIACLIAQDHQPIIDQMASIADYPN